jgi:hypothetical protein
MAEPRMKAGIPLMTLAGKRMRATRVVPLAEEITLVLTFLIPAARAMVLRAWRATGGPALSAWARDPTTALSSSPSASPVSDARDANALAGGLAAAECRERELAARVDTLLAAAMARENVEWFSPKPIPRDGLARPHPHGYRGEAEGRRDQDDRPGDQDRVRVLLR